MQDEKTNMDFHRSNEPSMGELLNFALSLRYELQDLKNLAKNHLESQKPVISKLPGPETSTEFYTSEQVKAKLKVKDRTLYYNTPQNSGHWLR